MVTFERGFHEKELAMGRGANSRGRGSEERACRAYSECSMELRGSEGGRRRVVGDRVEG